MKRPGNIQYERKANALKMCYEYLNAIENALERAPEKQLCRYRSFVQKI